MALRYGKIRNNPKTFHRLFGITPSECEGILVKLDPLWKNRIRETNKRPGRNYKLDLADMLLMLLLYYRSYMTQRFVGTLFEIDDSRVCRIIKTLEPLLASVTAIPKSKFLPKEEVETLLIDATEQPIERPQKGQKPYYSGKKKRHTMKTEIRTTREGRIVRVSKNYPGSVHDFTVFKREKRPPKTSRVLVDSGYQGIAEIHPNADFPYKTRKNKPLDREEKTYNTVLSRVRVKVENIFAQIKTFKIMSDRYRNKRKRYAIKFMIIAGIVNLKNGFFMG